jgi:hypothetical protein
MLRLVPQDVDVAVGDPGGGETAGHGLGRLRRVAGGVAGVDLDQLLEDLALERTRIGGLGGESRGQGGER